MGVGTHRKDPEKAAEDVFPFRDPGDRFHVKGVNGKEGCHERACPGRVRHERQDDKKQKPAGRMDQHTCPVMPAGIQTVKLAVQHVRQPDRRLPETGVDVRERPHDPFRRETAPNLAVVRHVDLVIVIDEIK